MSNRLEEADGMINTELKRIMDYMDFKDIRRSTWSSIKSFTSTKECATIQQMHVSLRSTSLKFDPPIFFNIVWYLNFI